jgi:hypothetical protein
MKKYFITAVAAALVGFSVPAYAQGIGHSFFMRGSVVGTDASGTVVCIGKADGAEVGQTLEVYRNVYHPVPNKTASSSYHRKLIAHVKIDHIFDEHFAHVSVVDGQPAKNDVVELRRN